MRLTDATVLVWEAVLLCGCLYIQIPSCVLPESSRDGFVKLLEYAEVVIKCNRVIICFKKDRTDRVNLIRTFMYLGFMTLPPGHPLVPAADDCHLFMLYVIE